MDVLFGCFVWGCVQYTSGRTTAPDVISHRVIIITCWYSYPWHIMTARACEEPLYTCYQKTWLPVKQDGWDFSCYFSHLIDSIACSQTPVFTSGFRPSWELRFCSQDSYHSNKLHQKSSCYTVTKIWCIWGIVFKARFQ